jgi:probable phosphoglycerate mutase
MIDRARWVWLVRHGESEANAGQPSPSPGTIALTARGRRQAAAMAARLEVAPTKIVTSSLLRSIETADAVRERHPGVESEIWPIQEFDYLPRDVVALAIDCEARRSASQAYWLAARPETSAGDGAESFVSFFTRVVEARDRLAREPASGLVFVSHRKFLSALVFSILVGDGRPTARSMRRYRAFDQGFRLPNAAVVSTLWTGGRIFVGAVDRSGADAP